MKKLIILACFFSWLFQVTVAQDTASGKAVYPPVKKSHQHFFREKNHEYYERKFNSKETGAGLLLAGGTLLGTIGYFVYHNNINNTSTDIDGAINNSFNAFGGAVAMVAGGLMISGSVPLFISANHYKKKAFNTSASLRLQQAPELLPKGIAYVPFPSLSLAIHF
jgi:hypothetical protein